MLVDTLLLCFCEDVKINDGTEEKPYFMSKHLMVLSLYKYSVITVLCLWRRRVLLMYYNYEQERKLLQMNLS